ncbi:hypothetical protein E1A91_A08G182400v1 [Gossypium mustelinum]|uniref:Zinc finger GRF-type domain-containing protein n=3 Tax=Gossypium TaxID=3633 RepID=A0A5D2YAX3_GOSMU|nr:hypothetical protein ES288_A08G193200v1 [Gossypium darwinii]TYI15551.1 hypothetical protein ES332_A08G194100v1 [Gossypium tomentosum]TYJ23302.1 hypothetical protein E1A91_A08G182400v1 [Gossypium mustelinum]
MDIPEVIPVCYCGNPAKLNTSWSNDNPGRRFFGRKKFSSGFRKPCRFFSWFDPPLTPRLRVVLLGLLKKVKTLEDARKRERRTWFLVLVIVTVLLFSEP